MSAAIDLHMAIVSVWNSQNLDSHFTSYWDSGETDLSLVLHDQMATPGQPMPYCLMDIGIPFTVNRMSCGADTISEVRDFPIKFSVHARYKPSVSSKSPKDIASDIVEEILKVFGGHPTVKPQALTLASGEHLITTYENDYGMRTGEDEHAWLINYRARVDIPVQALTS